MNIHLTLMPLVALIAGILILVMPKLLNYIIALYLIIIGVVGLFGSSLHLHWDQYYFNNRTAVASRFSVKFCHPI